MSESQVATAADFRADAESLSWSAPEPVTLPHSKRVVMLRKPTRFHESLRRLNWSEELRAKVDNAESHEALAKDLTREEMAVILADRPKMLVEAFVQPQVSLAAGPERFHPEILHDDDRDFILKYLRGQIDAKGVDLEAFREGQSSPTGSGSADGGKVSSQNPAGVSGAAPR
jgi:hypothetical protein